MKYLKKLASMVLSLAMALSLAVPALAAEKVDNQTDHTYQAYQIFAATNQANADGALGNITWGKGINSSAFLTALKADSRFVVAGENIFESCSSAQAVADALAGNVSVAEAFADVAVECITDVYTAIPEKDDVELDLGYWLLVDVSNLGDYDAKNAALLQVVKGQKLTIQKKYDVPSVDKTVNDNDANIGDTVTFTLTATMPDRLDGYETYKIIFHDTLSAGLAFVEDTVKVTVDGTDKTSAFTAKHENGVLTVSCNDVLGQGAKENSKIVVTYDAILDDDAVIGDAGNPNTVYLEYSNDPNWNGVGDEPTGDTPPEVVKVYTWEIPVFKYTGTNTALAGAGFTLYTDAQCNTAVNLVAVPDSIVYKVCTQTGCTDHFHITEIMTGDTGKFEIEGLQKGEYYLKETTTPAGYNTCDVVKVVIGDNGALTQNGTATTEVGIQNNTGATLPETGGMGTTLFYILGGVLVIGAGVALVTKKRMG